MMRKAVPTCPRLQVRARQECCNRVMANRLHRRENGQFSADMSFADDGLNFWDRRTGFVVCRESRRNRNEAAKNGVLFQKSGDD
jgi:hypothetical protein